MIAYIDVMTEGNVSLLHWDPLQEGNHAMDLGGLFQTAGLGVVNWQTKSGRGDRQTACLPSFAVDQLLKNGRPVNGPLDAATCKHIETFFAKPLRPVVLCGGQGSRVVSNEALASAAAVIATILRKETGGINTMTRTSLRRTALGNLETSDREALSRRIQQDRKGAGDELTEIAKKIQTAETCSWTEAFQRACNQRPDLSKAYTG